MAPPLSPDFTYRVLWHDDALPPAVESGRRPPAEVDVVVVGAGYCGLAAARSLVERGRSVAVIERDPLGFGASTRNGGMVIPELHAPPRALRRHYGPLGQRMWRAVNAAFDRTEQMIATEGIDCDYARTGQLYLAHHERVVPRLRRYAEEMRAEGEDVHLVLRPSLGEEIGSTAYPAGVVIARTGGLQPAKFHAALASSALGVGAEVIDRTLVVGVDPAAGAGWVVRTDRGSVACGEVFLAANATVDDAFPALRRRVLPVGSYIVATDPLPTDLALELSPRGRMFVDTKNLLFYWRISPDGRMVFGGRKTLAPPTAEQARDYLAAEMVRVHPQLDGVPIAASWGGYVAITPDRLPHCGQRDGVWYATGCNGSGVALMPWLGEQMAGAIAGDLPLPPFAELSHRPIPLWSLRDLTLPLAGTWFRAQDRGWIP